jgi:hypothetical protein
MVEIWFGIVHGKCLKGNSFRSVAELYDTLTAFSANWDEHFAHPFRWGYTGAGLAEKAVCRLTDWLLLEQQGMKCSFMLKQLMLMTNLASDYWQQVPTKRWEALLSTLSDKEDYFQRVINTNEHSDPPKNEGKETTKKKREEAMKKKREEAMKKKREEAMKKKREDTQKARDVLIALLADKTAPDSRASAA